MKSDPDPPEPRPPTALALLTPAQRAALVAKALGSDGQIILDRSLDIPYTPATPKPPHK